MTRRKLYLWIFCALAAGSAHVLEATIHMPQDPTSKTFEAPAQKYPQIKILVTSALLKRPMRPLQITEMRNEQYTRTLLTLNEYGYQPYVVEACQTSPPSLFEEFTPLVCYSNVNDNRLRNKGVNEAKSLIEAFRHFNFSDEDFIVKLTGRYCFINRDFLNMVEQHPELDACVCYQPNFPIPNVRTLTGCFGLRGKFFKQFLANLDLVKMEKMMLDIEIELGNFIRGMSKTDAHIIILDQLGLSVNVGGTTYPPIYEQW